MQEKFITREQVLEFQIFVDDWVEKATTVDELDQIYKEFLQYFENELYDKCEKLEGD